MKLKREGSRICRWQHAWLWVFVCGNLIAAPHDQTTFNQSVATLVKDHCVTCHGPDAQEGDLRLDNLPPDFNDSQIAGKWIEVMDNLNLGEMPPDDEDRPPNELVAKVTDWIATELRHAETLAKGTGGRVLMRRLSRTEYANAVRDLLEVEFLPGEGPKDLLPPDGRLDGFDKVSKALLLDPSLMEQYFEVASIIANKAVITGDPPVPTRRNRMQYEDIRGGIEAIGAIHVSKLSMFRNWQHPTSRWFLVGSQDAR